jgi:hypothetical protein
MARPTEDPPEWGTAESNDTEPGSGQKATGWTIGQVAISSFQNWWQRVAYEWLEWTKGVFDGGEGDWRLVHTRTDASQTPLTIGQGPEAGLAGNAWKKLFRANAGGDRNFRILSGKISQSQGAVLTLNADWDPATQQWSLEDPTGNAFAIALDWGGTLGLTSWRKASGSGPWGPVAWDRGNGSFAAVDLTGNLGVNGDIALAGSLGMGGNLLVTGDATISDDLTVTDDTTLNSQLTVNGLSDFNANLNVNGSSVINANSHVFVGGELQYPSSKTRTRTWNANAFQLSETPATRSANAGTITGNAGGATNHVLHLEAPSNSTLFEVQVHYDASGGSQVIVNVERITQPAGTVVDLRAAGGLNSGSTGTELTMTYACDQNNINLGTAASIQVRVTLAASTGAVLRGVTVVWLMDRPKVF